MKLSQLVAAHSTMPVTTQKQEDQKAATGRRATVKVNSTPSGITISHSLTHIYVRIFRARDIKEAKSSAITRPC